MRLGFAISLWHLFRGAFWSENLVWKIMRQSWGHMPTFQGMFWLWGCTSYYRSFFPHLLSLQKCFRLFFCRNLPKMRSVEKSGKKRVDVSNKENGTHCIYNSSSRFEPQQRSGTHGFTRLAPMWLRQRKLLRKLRIQQVTQGFAAFFWRPPQRSINDFQKKCNLAKHKLPGWLFWVNGHIDKTCLLPNPVTFL